MNIELGKYNQLEVVKEVDFGLYLDGGDDGEILLPARYVPEGTKVGVTREAGRRAQASGEGEASNP